MLSKPLRFLIALLALVGGFAQAQTIPVSLGWTLPTTSVDGVPLTGANALTGIEVHWATAPIADADTSRAAQVTLGVVGATTQQIAATNGTTLHFRVRSVRSNEKSVFSNQVTKLVSLSTVPLPPTNLRIDIVVSQTDRGVQFSMVVREAWEDTIYNGG